MTHGPVDERGRSTVLEETGPSSMPAAIELLSIAYVARGLPHYRMALFEELATRGVRSLVIKAGALGDGFIGASEQPGSMTMLELSRRVFVWRTDVLDALRRFRPDAIILEHGASLDFTWSVLLSGSLGRTPRLLWTHGVERREHFTGQKTIASWGRWCQADRADGVITYDPVFGDTLRKKFPDKIIGVAPNSTDGRRMSIAGGKLLREGRSAVRERLGLDDRPHLVGLGRLVPEKQFHRVVAVLKEVRRAGIDAGAMFIGAGPEIDRIRGAGLAAGLVEGKDYMFVGSVSDPERFADLLFAADLCVQPGYLGLSVVDCLFGGVPTLSVMPGPRGPYHSPEWRYLEQGVTGILVSENSDRALANEAIKYLRLPMAERQRREAACVRYAQDNLGIGRMVDGMLEVIGAACARKSRATTR